MTAKANAYVSKPLVYTHGSKVVTPLIHHQDVANPAITYTGYPAVHNFAPVAPSVVNPVMSQSVVTPNVVPMVSQTQVYNYNVYIQHPYASVYGRHLVNKPEADAQVVYPAGVNTYSALNNFYSGRYNYAPVASSVYEPVSPSEYNYMNSLYTSLNDTHHLVAKREAEPINPQFGLNSVYSGFNGIQTPTTFTYIVRFGHYHTFQNLISRRKTEWPLIGGHFNNPFMGRTMASVFLAMIQSFRSCQVHDFMIVMVYPLPSIAFTLSPLITQNFRETRTPLGVTNDTFGPWILSAVMLQT